MKKTLNKFKNQCLLDNIPIVSDEVLSLMAHEIKKNNSQLVLELGTAVGYSAVCLATYGPDVITIERDSKRYAVALKNIDLFELTSKITVINHDVLTVFFDSSMQFDLIFIDAAKAQYQKMFTKFAPFLAPHGVIIADNLNFHHLEPKNVSRHTRQLLKKIAQFKEFLVNNQEFETVFHETIGDGVSISKRRV